jgi:predicted dehydrogenase
MAGLHRVLILGVGSIGERHLRCFRATGRAVASFVEVNATLRQTVAARYGIRQHYSTLEEALADRPGVAVIATPAALHVPLALRLVEAGLHLLIEKPLSTSLDGIERLWQRVARHGVIAGVGYVYRLYPVLAAMRRAIVEGRFGTPVQLVAVSGQHFPTFRPAYRTIYYTDRAQGGGAIQDALTHLLNAGEWLIGPVDQILADAAHQVLEGVEVEDTVHVLTRHGRALGCYSLNQHQAPNEITITVICDRGTARCELHQNRWRWMTQPGESWHDEQFPPVERDTPFLIQAHLFLDAVEGKAMPACSLEEGIHTLGVNLAALASVDEGTWQLIYPEAHYSMRSAP